MYILKVTYDAYNRHFRLEDETMANMFEDGHVCLLVVDFFPSSMTEQFINLNEIEIGHA